MPSPSGGGEESTHRRRTAHSKVGCASVNGPPGMKKGQRARFAPAKPAAQEVVVEAPEIFSFSRPVSRCLLAADYRASQKTW